MDKQTIKIYKQQNYKLNKWSGGTTKQLMIYPQDGDYAQRIFKFRISIATTENQKSTFTKLQNVDRVISVLQGKMEINHHGHYSKVLNTYEIDRFKGDWDTSSFGKVTDFNLMLKGCKGDFFFKQIVGELDLAFEQNHTFIFVYCIQGKIVCKDKQFGKGQLLFAEEKQIKLISEQKSKIFYGFMQI